MSHQQQAIKPEVELVTESPKVVKEKKKRKQEPRDASVAPVILDTAVAQPVDENGTAGSTSQAPVERRQQQKRKLAAEKEPEQSKEDASQGPALVRIKLSTIYKAFDQAVGYILDQVAKEAEQSEEEQVPARQVQQGDKAAQPPVKIKLSSIYDAFAEAIDYILDEVADQSEEP